MNRSRSSQRITIEGGARGASPSPAQLGAAERLNGSDSYSKDAKPNSRKLGPRFFVRQQHAVLLAAALLLLLCTWGVWRYTGLTEVRAGA